MKNKKIEKKYIIATVLLFISDTDNCISYMGK